MPPANSPSEALPDIASPNTYTDQLLDSRGQVPNIPMTLVTRPEDEINEDFPRTTSLAHLYGQSRTQDRSPNSRTNATTIPSAEVRMENQRRRRMERMENERRRTAELSLQRQLSQMRNGLNAQRSSSYHPSGYQGWAPGTAENESDEPHLTMSDLRALARGHLRAGQDTATRRHFREQELRQLDDSLERRDPIDYDMDWDSDRSPDSGQAQQSIATESSLRTTALLQSVRRHARFSPRSWNRTDTERERRVHDDEDRQRGYANYATDRREQVLFDDMRSGMALDLRRSRGAESHTAEASKYLEEAIKYLERLRFCDSYSDRISSAEAGGFIRGEHFIHNHEDFILDTSIISQPKASSWLRAGGVFSGSQHATGMSPLPLFHFSSNARRRSGRESSARESSGRESSTRDTYLSATNPSSGQALSGSWINNVISRTATEGGSDSWPVKVTINSIDYERMTLTGTMEAFNVPTKSSVQELSITTYLEGEIIDFNRYTLETKSFNANSSVDSTYWRKLEPFKNLTDTEVVNNLVSRKWLCDEFAQKWILMRWKEKCFVTPSDAQLGLTISGFYYISMRREDGRVEGLYYDPQSSPYQHLSLTPEKRTFPAYTFA